MLCPWPSFPRTREPSDFALAHNFGPKIIPVRIGPLDQVQLPFTPPLLDALLARDGGIHRAVLLEPDQLGDAVLLAETVDEMFAVLPDALNQVAGDTEVEGAVSSAGKEVHGGLQLLHGTGFPRSRE